jgi:hypothetical protein
LGSALDLIHEATNQAERMHTRTPFGLHFLNLPLFSTDICLMLMKMDSSTIASSSEAGTVDSNQLVQKSGPTQIGRPAMMVDGKMRWITEDGTPGDPVSHGNFYFSQFDDGTFLLSEKETYNERE